MSQKITLLTISIVLILFFIIPMVAKGEDVNWPLEKKDVENFLDIIRKKPLTKANEDLYYESLGSYNPDSPRKTGAVVLAKQAILKKQLDYWFKEIPTSLSIKFIQTAFKIIPLIYSQDISTILDIIEKVSVEKATDYAIKWLLQNEIKIGSGEASYIFSSYKGNTQKLDIQYIIVYHPINQTQGRIIAEFYSKDPVEPPEGRGGLGAPANNFDNPNTVCWPWDRWLENEQKGNNDGKLEPFIVRVKGNVAKGDWGIFNWDKTKGEPTVEVDFDNPVPEIEKADVILANPPSKTSLTKEILKLILEKLKPKLEDTKDFASGIKDGLKDSFSNLLEKLQSYILGLSPQAQLVNFGPAAQTIFKESTPIQEESTEKIEEILKTEPSSPSTPAPNLGVGWSILEQIIEKLDDLSEEAEILLAQGQKFLTDKIDETKKEEAQKQQEQEELPKEPEPEEIEEEIKKEPKEDETEKKVIFCSPSPSHYPQGNKVIFNEIAWMGTANSSNDEWIELKNISNNSVNLKGWQILDKDTQIKIIFGDIVVASGKLLILERTDDNSVPNIKADLIYTGILSNSDEALYLFDKNCELQDKVEAKPYWQAGDNSSKKTMERKADFTWQTSRFFGGTPKIENSPGEIPSSGGITPPPPSTPEKPSSTTTPPPKILITEVQIEDASSSDNDFIELFNPSTSSADVSGFQLKKKSSTGKEYSIRDFPSSAFIPAQDYFLWANSNYASSVQIEADTTSTQTLSKNNSIALLDKKGSIIDAVAWGTSTNPFVETLPFPQNPEENHSLGRKTDNDGKYIDTNDNSQDFELQSPTPKAKNQAPQPSQPPQPPKNQSPIAVFSFLPQEPEKDQELLFNAASSSDPDGEIVSYNWDFGDGNSTTTDQATTTHSFATSSEFQVTLNVIDDKGATSTATSTIVVKSKKESYSVLDVVINEIAWMGTTDSSNDEWVELYNNTNKEINLIGWTLSWGEATSTHYVSLTGTIPPYGFYLLERTASTTISDTEEDQIYTGALKNTKISGGKYRGEKIELEDSNSDLIDIVDCSSEWSAGNNDTKHTMERVNPRISGNKKENWANNDGKTINGLDAGVNPIYGTPKAKNSVFSTAPPEAVPGFAIDEENSKYNRVLLFWSTTTDPDTENQDISYFIYYSKNGEITNSNIGSSDSTSTASTTIIISNLFYDSTYYFGIKAFDGENYSLLATTTPYTTPLAPITNLNAGPSAIREAIDLLWTSQGTEKYIIKYSEKEIVEEAEEDQVDFENATSLETSIVPKKLGEIEILTLENLSQNKTYYFAIRTINTANATSEISNLTKAKALPGFQDNGDGTITDLYTGLIWVKDGAEIGTNNGQALTLDEAISFANNLVLCQDGTFVTTTDFGTSTCSENSGIKYDDWRLPSFKELASIINYNKNTPTAYENYFINTASDSYWTSSYEFIPGSGCYGGGYCAYPASWEIRIVDFSNGTIKITYDRNAYYFVRPVRGQDLEGSPLKTCNLGYTDNGDGTITDNCTKLMWAQGGTRALIGEEDNYPLSPRPKTISWNNAVNLCNNLNLGGYTDWRLPNIFELLITVSSNFRIFPWESAYSFYYWAFTSFDNEAWGMENANNLGNTQLFSKNNGLYIQCLRNVED